MTRAASELDSSSHPLGRTATIAAIAVVVFGLWIRFANAQGALFFADEWHTIAVASLRFGRVLETFDKFGTGIGLPLIMKVVAGVFGDGQLAARAPALAGGALTVVLTGAFGRRFFGATVGWIAASFVALNSISIFYSSFARSYSILCALALILAYAVCALGARETRSWRYLVIAAAAAAIAPYFHLTSLAVVGAIAGAGVLMLALDGAPTRAKELSISIALGLILCCLLFLPAGESVRAFVATKSDDKYAGAFGVLDVAAVLVGNRWLAGALLIGLVSASAALLATRRARALPLLFAIGAAPAAVSILRPYGDAYAYARYVITSVPFAALLLAWALQGLVRRAFRSRPLAEPAALALGLALALGAFAAGSFGTHHTAGSRFASTYFSLYPLPAFDRPFDRTPPVYETIQADSSAERILELPHITHKGLALYRNYFLQHGKDVQTGFLRRRVGALPNGYPSLVVAGWADELDVDYVVLHLDVAREIQRYWRFVFSDPELESDDATTAYMARMKVTSVRAERADEAAVLELTRELGEPIYRDSDVVAWKR